MKVIGIGGIGSIVAEYAALWLNTLAITHDAVSFRLVLIDGDAFEPANSRMYFNEYGNKAVVKARELIDRLGERLQRLLIDAVEQYVSPANIDRLIRDGDCVLMCVDSHASRKLVSDHFATKITDGVLISGGNDGVGEDTSGRVLRGTYGNCQVYVRRHGADCSPSLTRYHDEIARPTDRLPTDQACTELAASVPQLLFANFWAAGTMLATLFLSLCQDDALKYSELAFDFAEGRVQPIGIPGPSFDQAGRGSRESSPQRRRGRREEEVD
ncbi:MAG: ThiF family adenylyltransferase [Planctomycetota bacterium]